MIITLIAISGCGEEGIGDIASEGAFTLVLGEGEEQTVGDGVLPQIERGDLYISGWYLDAGRTKELKLDTSNIADIKKKLEESGEGSRLYAKWEEKKEMEGVRTEDAFFIYDGAYHGINISADGAETEYEGEGEYKDAGEYEIKGKLTKYGYKDKTFSCTLTIAKRRLDVSGIELNSATYVWDGEKKYLTVSGDLPDDIEIEYTNNGHSEVGEYEVTVTFDTHGNYEDIAEQTATLTILEKKYKVLFIEEDGSEREIEVGHGKGIEEMPIPKEKRGYRGYWSEESIDSVYEDMKVYARYEKERYKIEYVLNGGEIKGEVISEYEIGDEFNLPVPEREYYEFVGWTEDGEKVSGIEEGEIGDRVYEAEWKAKEYVIRYEVNGGINSTENIERYTAETDDIELKSAYRYGYEFIRWTDEEGKEVSIIESGSPRNITLYAQWKANSYKITYVMNGGENDGTNPEEYSIEDGTITLNEAKREGYVFAGWYEDEECSGERVEEIESERCEDIRLYAKWENKYEYRESAEGVIITGYSYDNGNEAVIPKEIDGKKVTGIDRGVLSGAKRIEINAEIALEDGVFEGCTETEEIVIGSSATKLGIGLFKDCIRVRSMTLPYTGTRALSGEDGRYEPMGMLFGNEEKAGLYGVGITTLVVRNGVEDYEYSESERRYIPESLEEIRVSGGEVAGYALEGMTSVKRIEVSGEEVKIGRCAMRNCGSLEEIIIEGEIREFNNTALLGCGILGRVQVTREEDMSLVRAALVKAGLEAVVDILFSLYSKLIAANV